MSSTNGTMTRRAGNQVRFSGIIVKHDASLGQDQTLADPQFFCYGMLSKQSQKLVAVRDSLRLLPLAHVGMFFTAELGEAENVVGDEAAAPDVLGPYMVVFVLGLRIAALTDAILYERLLCTGIGSNARADPPLLREQQSHRDSLARAGGVNAHLGRLVISAAGDRAAAKQQLILGDLCNAFALERDYVSPRAATGTTTLVDLLRLFSVDARRAAALSYAELAALADHKPGVAGEPPSLEFLFVRSLLPQLCGATRHRGYAVGGIYVGIDNTGILPPASRIEATYGNAHAVLAYRLYRVAEFLSRSEARDAPAGGLVKTPRGFLPADLDAGMPKKIARSAADVEAALQFLCDSGALVQAGARFALTPDYALAKRIWSLTDSTATWLVRLIDVGAAYNQRSAGLINHLLELLGYTRQEARRAPTLVLGNAREIDSLLEHAQHDDNGDRYSLDLALHYDVVVALDCHLLSCDRVERLLGTLARAAALRAELLQESDVGRAGALTVLLCGDAQAYGGASGGGTFGALYDTKKSAQFDTTRHGTVAVPRLCLRGGPHAELTRCLRASRHSAEARDSLVAKLRTSAMLEFSVTVIERADQLAQRLTAPPLNGSGPRRFIVLGSPDGLIGSLAQQTDIVATALTAVVSNTLQTLLFCTVAPFIGFGGYCYRIEAAWLLARPPAIATAAFSSSECIRLTTTDAVSLDDQRLFVQMPAECSLTIDHRVCCSSWAPNVMHVAAHRTSVCAQSFPMARHALPFHPLATFRGTNEPPETVWCVVPDRHTPPICYEDYYDACCVATSPDSKLTLAYVGAQRSSTAAHLSTNRSPVCTLFEDLAIGE